MSNVQLTSHAEHSSVSFRQSQETLMMASIKCGEIVRKEGEAARAPIHLCAVVDRSGSMAGEKMELVKKSMEFVIRQLKESDKFSVVSFDDRITVEFPMQQMSASAKTAALSAVSAMHDRGSTNLSGGLFAGFDQIAGINLSQQVLGNHSGTRSRGQGLLDAALYPWTLLRNSMSAITKTMMKENGAVTSVWLFTDGLANAGVQDEGELKRMTAMLLARLPSCTLYTFGFGSDHNSSLLQQLATSGGGVYYFVKDPSEITVCYADCLGGLVSVYAQNLQLKLTCSKGVTVVKVHTPFPITTDGSQTIITMRDMYEEEARDIVVLVRLSAIDNSSEAWKCVEWELEYTDAVTKEPRVLAAEQFIERLEESTPNQIPPIVLDQQRNRIRSVEALDEARKAGDRGDLEAARAVLKSAIDAITKSVSGKEVISVGLIDTLKDSLSQLSSREEYNAKGKNQMQEYFSSHTCQRGTAKTEASYQNKSKAMMKSAFSSY